MEVRDLAYADWKNGMKYREIAEKYDVSLSAVKSWATRYWKVKKLQPTHKKSCNQEEKSCNQKQTRGAPRGNRNAKGNRGGGAPKGNLNNFRHGAFAKVYFEQMTDEELELLDMIEEDEETQLKNQLIMLTIRERRHLDRIKELQDGAKKGQTLSRITSQKSKEYYGAIQNQDKAKGKKGNIYESTTTETESVSNYIVTLEAELTKIQRAKTQAAKALADYHLNRERLKMEREKNSDEIEDMSEVEGEIYG